MTTPQDSGFGVGPLPPYRSMLVVDMKDYSGAPGRQHAHLNAVIPEILQSAFARCALEGLWNEISFADSTGDGYAIGLPAERLPFLLNPFLGSLQDELTDRSRMLTAAGFADIRMRVSVTVGPVSDSGADGVSDGAGNARVELHRLLDSEPVRDLLTRSGDATRVAAIVSARAFEDAVAARYTDEDPDLYVAVPVKVKRYEGQAYLRVPLPSGDLLTSGFRSAEDPAGERSRAEQLGEVVPEPRQTARVEDNTRYRRGGVGSIAGNVGSIVSDPTGPTNSGSGTQHNHAAHEPR
ncbi:hypothetical protein EV137_7412 [Kribbella pratensis]|uniref:Guanylate cyclase domain-containing protein n=1 Tax=Kribbella pratensis TaxID=2512112 RepID=A0ABY2F4C8_9ACTN|nr:hypothetical protein [Kribbella pratensis]TDW81408.1 hypothetical protein EV137_7412 [Kribbella pratensis]